MKNMNKNLEKRRNSKKGFLKFKNIIIILVMIFIISIFLNKNFCKEKTNFQTCTVKESQTLWNIANNICKENENLNIRSVIFDIKKANNLDNNLIYVGQVLQIPIYD